MHRAARFAATLAAAGCLFVAAAGASTASAVNCLGYLSAERSFQKKTGSQPDHKAIESRLSKLPSVHDIPYGEGAWHKYIDASNELDWATESQAELYNEHNRQTLLGKSIPNYRIKSSTAFERVQEAISAKKAASDELDRWLGEHAIDSETADLFSWFVSVYRETHKVFSNKEPDLVFRVAVHERRTSCPP